MVNQLAWGFGCRQITGPAFVVMRMQNDYIMNGHLGRDSRYVRVNRGLSKLLHERPT